MGERKGPDKLTVIIEETVQHVYTLDPEDQLTVQAFHALPRLLSGDVLETIPMGWDRPSAKLGHRAKKGAAMPNLLLNDLKAKSDGGVVTYSRYTGLTMVLPDENGNPAEEIKVTPKTIQRKPVKK